MAPISEQNFINILLYAWRLYPWPSISINAGKDKSTEPFQILAKIVYLAALGIEKQGFKRNYTTTQEVTLLPKGRINFGQSIQLRASGNNALSVEYDEFSSNCLENQVLLWVINKVSKLEKIGGKLKQSLYLLERRIPASLPNKISRRDLRLLTRNNRNRNYKLIFSVAELLSEEMLFNSNDASNEFSITDDKKSLETIFESFLREFYRHNVKGMRISGRKYEWGNHSSGIIPELKTDINLNDDDSTHIIDAKYTPYVLKKNQSEKLKLDSGHLYQLMAYLLAEKRKHPEKRVRGTLIYPLFSHPVDEYISQPLGESDIDYIRIKTIDLIQPWKDLCSELFGIID